MSKEKSLVEQLRECPRCGASFIPDRFCSVIPYMYGKQALCHECSMIVEELLDDNARRDRAEETKRLLQLGKKLRRLKNPYDGSCPSCGD